MITFVLYLMLLVMVFTMLVGMVALASQSVVAAMFIGLLVGWYSRRYRHS